MACDYWPWAVVSGDALTNVRAGAQFSTMRVTVPPQEVHLTGSVRQMGKQTTIPTSVRKLLQLKAGGMVEFEIKGNQVRLRRATPLDPFRYTQVP